MARRNFVLRFVQFMTPDILTGCFGTPEISILRMDWSEHHETIAVKE